MNPSEPQHTRTEAALFQAMVWYSTLTTVADVWQAHRERRAGHDPSSQEAEAFVRPFLQESSKTLEKYLMQLQGGRIQTEAVGEDEVVLGLRRYQEMMVWHRITVLLQTMHQRLLSLYPKVPEALVETCRLLHVSATQLRDSEEPPSETELAAFMCRAFDFVITLKKMLA